MKKSSARYLYPILLILLLAAGFALRLSLHAWHGLEGDDAVALYLTRYDFGDLIDGLRRQALDVHPPLYFVLLKLWTGVAGESLLALRLLNIAADVLAGALLLRLAHNYAGRKTALLAGALWLVAPLLLYADYTVRMYSLLTLWLTLGVACLLAYVRQAGTRRGVVALVGLGLASLAALYTHIFGALLVGGALAVFGVLALLGQLRWRDACAGWAMLLGVGVAFLPFGIPIAERFLAGGSLGAQTPGSLRPPLEIPGQLVQTLMTHRILEAPLFGVLWLIVALIGGVLVWRMKRPDARALVVLFVASYAGLLVLALASDLYRPRYLAPFVPLWLALLAGGIARLPRSVATVAFLACFAVSSAGMLDNLHRNAYDDWVAAAHFIEAHQQAGDAVLIVPDWGAKAFNYHYQGGLPVKALFSSVPADIDLDPLLTEAAQGADRLWLVRYQVDVSDPTNRISDWFDARGTTITESFPTSIQIIGYDFAPSRAAVPDTARVLDAELGEMLRVRGATLVEAQGSAQDDRLHPPSAWVQGTLYAEALSANIPYTLRIRLTDGVGATWGGMLERENDMLHRYPLATWEAGKIYELPFDLVVNPAAPAGIYNVEVMLLDAAAQPLPATGADAGQFWVIVGQYQVD